MQVKLKEKISNRVEVYRPEFKPSLNLIHYTYILHIIIIQGVMHGVCMHNVLLSVKWQIHKSDNTNKCVNSISFYPLGSSVLENCHIKPESRVRFLV